MQNTKMPKVIKNGKLFKYMRKIVDENPKNFEDIPNAKEIIDNLELAYRGKLGEEEDDEC